MDLPDPTRKTGVVERRLWVVSTGWPEWIPSPGEFRDARPGTPGVLWLSGGSTYNLRALTLPPGSFQLGFVRPESAHEPCTGPPTQPQEVFSEAGVDLYAEQTHFLVLRWHQPEIPARALVFQLERRAETPEERARVRQTVHVVSPK